MEVYPDSRVYYTSFSRPLKAADNNGNLCIVLPRLDPKDQDYQLLVDYPRETISVNTTEDEVFELNGVGYIRAKAIKEDHCLGCVCKGSDIWCSHLPSCKADEIWVELKINESYEHEN
jgi:hypothetical protein